MQKSIHQFQKLQKGVRISPFFFPAGAADGGARGRLMGGSGYKEESGARRGTHCMWCATS